MVPLLDPTKHWECPSCGRQHVTKTAQVTSELHACPAQHGLAVPFVEVTGSELKRGTVRHVAVERGDYVGSEVGVRHDSEGKAVMAVRTERADGSNDVHVFAPSATARSN